MKRKIKYHRYLPVLLLISSTWVAAQSIGAKELLGRVLKTYEDQKEYAIEMQFTLYRGLEGKNSTDTYKGTMQRHGDYVCNTAGTTLIYHFPEATLSIDDTSGKIIHVGNPGNARSDVFNLRPLFQQYAKHQVLDQGAEWVVELVSQNNTFNTNPYSKIQLYIDKKTMIIRRQMLYFSNLMSFKNGEKVEQDTARLEIRLTHDFNAEVVPKKLSDFVRSGADKTLVLQPEYHKYKLIDQSPTNNQP